jgi:hypothetical protein
MSRCVLEKWDDDTLLFLFKCLGTGTTKVYPHPDHPDDPAKSLKVKEVIDPVVHGNYHPEGSKDRANETALYIRAMAMEEIAHAEADGEDARVKSLQHLQGLTGDNLVKAAGMGWYLTSLDQNKGREYTDFQRRLRPNVHYQQATDSDYREFGCAQGQFILVALKRRKQEQQVTGGGQKVISPRSQALMASSSSAMPSSKVRGRPGSAW